MLASFDDDDVYAPAYLCRMARSLLSAGAALLIDGHPDIVARAGADGAHLGGTAAMEEAMPSLKPDRIVGVGGLGDDPKVERALVAGGLANARVRARAHARAHARRDGAHKVGSPSGCRIRRGRGRGVE